MPNFGFRVYTAQIKREEPPRSVRWSDVHGGYASHLQHCSTALIQAQGGPPDIEADLEEPFEAGATYTDIQNLEFGQKLHASGTDQTLSSWLPAELHAGQKISFRFLAGSRGEFDRAMGGTGRDTSLAGRAASRPYRAEMLIPATVDGKSLLAVEAVGGYCPVRPLSKLLGYASKLLSLKEMNEKAGKGEVVGQSDRYWYHPSTKQVTDPGYLAKLMSDPDQAAVIPDLAQISAQQRRP
jgi:hypothetical protein